MSKYDVSQLTAGHSLRLRAILGERYRLIPSRITDEQIPTFFEHITLGDLSGMDTKTKNFISLCYDRMTGTKTSKASK